jgi:hypothetical protein
VAVERGQFGNSGKVMSAVRSRNQKTGVGQETERTRCVCVRVRVRVVNCRLQMRIGESVIVNCNQES